MLPFADRRDAQMQERDAAAPLALAESRPRRWPAAATGLGRPLNPPAAAPRRPRPPDGRWLAARLLGLGFRFDFVSADWRSRRPREERESGVRAGPFWVSGPAW
jgi:hypothetical protein